MPPLLCQCLNLGCSKRWLLGKDLPASGLFGRSSQETLWGSGEGRKVRKESQAKLHDEAFTTVGNWSSSLLVILWETVWNMSQNCPTKEWGCWDIYSTTPDSCFLSSWGVNFLALTVYPCWGLLENIQAGRSRRHCHILELTAGDSNVSQGDTDERPTTSARGNHFGFFLCPIYIKLVLEGGVMAFSRQ